MAEKIWEEGSDEVLVKAFAKTDKDSLFGANRPSNVKRLIRDSPLHAGSFLLFHRFIQYAIKLIHWAETVGIYRTTA